MLVRVTRTVKRSIATRTLTLVAQHAEPAGSAEAVPT
jgi:hypothetical protein